MALINLNFIKFYQPFFKADLAAKRLLITSTHDVLVVYREHATSAVSESSNECSERFQDYNLAEFLDLTGPLLMKLNLSHKSALNLKDADEFVRGTVYPLCI